MTVSYTHLGDKLNALGKDYMGEHGYSSIGLVIGGTHIEEATEIRAKYQDSFFLIPGYGAQGGKAEDIAPVSYTHLDVYKRQASPLPCSRA